MDNQQVRQTQLELLTVPGMERYMVDAEGNIYSNCKQVEPKKLKCYKHFGKSRNPYQRLKMNGKLYLAHRVIVSAMIGRQLNPGEFVNHIDGNTLNNKQSNLEVVTHQQNVQHAVLNNLHPKGEAWHTARATTEGL